MNSFYLYGMPRSGTWFLEHLICQNFKIKRSSGPNRYGKHYSMPDPDHKSEDPILVIYKNPYKWIESFIFRIDWFTDSAIRRKKLEDILESNTNAVMRNVTKRMLEKSRNPLVVMAMSVTDNVLSTDRIFENDDLNNEFLHKNGLIINQKYLALYWKKHFKNFNKLQNKEIIYYEDLISLENRVKFLNKIRQKYNFEPINSEWNIEIFNVISSPYYNENEMNPYYQQKNVFKFLKNNHLRLINECFENNWLNTNTQYEMIYEISDYHSS